MSAGIATESQRNPRGIATESEATPPRPDPTRCIDERSESLPLESSRSGAPKVYASPAEELAAWDRRFINDYYDDEWQRLHEALRERHRRAFQHERERLYAQVERLRGASLAEVEGAA